MGARLADLWPLCAACVLALVSGACLAFALLAWRRRNAAMRALKAGGTGAALDADCAGAHGIDDRIVAYAVALSKRIALGACQPVLPSSPRVGKRYGGQMKKAGLAGALTEAGLCESRWRLAFVAAAAGACFGAVFSTELMALLAVAGAGAGWAAVPWAVRQRARVRAEELERHLPEMLEVVALGMRSGLAFDRSLEMYAGHFDSLLARACASAKRQWTLGLVTREEALRELAGSYDSPLFSRVVENIIRSLRFGSSLAENLEMAAGEARTSYRARKQEQVAKAPVKMMVPTGALMLPAMLLLVLGPVLLELMEGF